MPILTEEQLRAARDWCIECWPDQEDEILEAGADVIERNIAKHYDGGLVAFMRESAC